MVSCSKIGPVEARLPCLGEGQWVIPLCEVIGSAKSYIIFGWFVLAGSFKVIQVVRLFLPNWYLPATPANHYVTTTGDAPNASQLPCVSPRGSKIYQVLREPTLSLHPSPLLTQMAEDLKDDKPIFMEGPWGKGMGTILHRICGESSVTVYSSYLTYILLTWQITVFSSSTKLLTSNCGILGIPHRDGSPPKMVPKWSQIRVNPPLKRL